VTRGFYRRSPGALFLPAAGVLLCLAAVCAAGPQAGPVYTIDEDCTAFSFGPDGRVAFAVRHVFSRHKFDIQRDDFWISDGGKGKHRILNGDKLDRGEGGFSYTVRSIRWSPGGKKLAAEVMTSTQAEHHGNAEYATQSFLLDANGQEIRIADGDSFIPESENATWLDDEATVVYLERQPKPQKDFTMWSVRPAAGHAERLFPSTYFLGAVWMERTRQAIAVESPDGGGKPRLVLLDLTKQTEKELASLDDYAGGLSLSPSGQKIAYFRDPGTLEVRSLGDPRPAHSVQALIGRYCWTHDEQHVLLKSGQERRSSVIESLRLADGASEELFRGLTFWSFAVTPDGRHIGVSPPGKHVVAVYDLPVLR
jgi:hypothetical protein